MRPIPFSLAVSGAVLLASAIRSDAADPVMSAPDHQAVTGELVGIPPTAPEDAAKTFRVLDGFRMELLASEPLVTSPVAMTYDENGRAYVCEMRDYPYTDKARHQPGQENPTDAPIGRIRLLEDVNGNGKFDKATVFAEGLSWPTGIAPWKGGVFVAATPDIWYLKDTDGDGVADVRRKVFTGFRKLNVQAVMNNLVWGLDNHIHGAGGSNGGQLRPGDQPDEQPLVMSRHDFRIDPVTEQLDLLSGGARFGGSFDDWGNRFVCNIRNPAQHIVLPVRYLTRNPHLAARAPIHDMAAAGDQLPVHPISPPEPWRVLRAQRWAGERDIVMPRSELVGAGVVTSSSGITSYRGTAYPEKYRGNVFVCESAGNLFYRLQLTPDSVTFQAARVDGSAEMVASTDNWFRPVNFVNAPDGTLHVIDMYRENIEHPWSIPEDIHAAVDLENGRDMGRIWRLAPPDFEPAKPPQLGRASTAELVATLDHADAWWRETAQRLLFERQDKSAAPALHALVKSGQTAPGRLHGLYTLHGLGELQDDDLHVALQDPSAGVREHAIKLAEMRPQNPELVGALLRLGDDSDARVRFQLAFTLGELPDPRALETLATIARRDAADPWIRTAVLSAVPHASDELLAGLLADDTFAANDTTADLVQELAQIVGVRGRREEMQRVFAAASTRGESSTALHEVVAGIGAGLKRSGNSLRGAGLAGDAAGIVDSMLSRAAQTAADTAQPLESRVTAIGLLAFDDFAQVRTTLASLLGPRQPQEVQLAAVAAIGSFVTPDAGPLLLANWPTQTPAVREEVVAAMLRVSARALPLLNAVESGLIPANQIPFAQRRTLGLSRIPEVKALAEKLFSASAPGPRKEVIERYQASLLMEGDVARGEAVFRVACIACHRAGDLGNQDLGPNLANIRAWSPEQVLINTLDPNREVDPRFVGYTVETTDGRSLYGLILEESETAITLKRLDGVGETVLRQDIAALSSTGVSLMPDGLEAALPPQSMADLIVFLLAPR